MAPSVEEWEALSPAERAEVVAALPGEATDAEIAMPNHGLYESRVLGLDVQVEEDRLRFYAGMAPLPESEDLIARLQGMYDSAQQRAENEEQLREVAERRREEEVQETPVGEIREIR
jgi:hypothetical protein